MTARRALSVFVFVLSAFLAAPLAHAQCVSLTTTGSAFTQNFNTLSNTAGSTTNNLTITGWFMTETGGGTRDNEQYAVDTGGSNTGDTFSYGAAGNTERALGGLQSGTLIPVIGACFTNNTGNTLTSLDVAYTGEQWRIANTAAARDDRMDFQYSLNATSLTTGTWTDVNALDFTNPIKTAGTAGALDGNNAANRTAISQSIPSLSIANGATFWIRWNDFNASGADDGLAVDDFSLTPQGGPVVPNLTINDVSQAETNGATTTFTFTVSLSAPAGPGGVTFDIATADGTAQDDNPATEDNDYVPQSLTGQTIPAGSSTYAFNVTVNGDVIPETNETFFVNVTNVTGANVTDGQGQGTITNDDVAPNLTVTDVTLSEGNAGPTTFSFTVNLSSPAPAGGVTFDIATADGTAQDDNPATEDNDYVPQALTGQTIPAGSSSYTFDVTVNGNLTPEGDETFFVNVTNVTNAIVTDGQGLGTITNDDLWRIHDVQGNTSATGMAGATVTVEGVVVGDYQASTQLSGFFLQEEDADVDADPATSEGIFIFCSGCPTAVAEGQRVRVTGTVSEFNNMTQITASTAPSIVVTNAGNNLAQVTPATIDLPVVGVVDDFYERREGMLVTFTDTLSVAEYFELFRFGHIELFEGGRPRQFTEDNLPSVAGYAAHLDNLDRRRVVLDDDDNQQNVPLTLPDGSQFVYHPRANGGFSVGTQGTDFFRGGDLVTGLTGVLHWSFPGTGANTWRLRPTSATASSFTVANPRPATPPAVGGAIKALSMNMLNYFTTIDTTSSNNSGTCGPSGTLDCRGADSAAELNRQRERASIVLCGLDPHVAGLMEVENTATATITDLLGAVNARCGGANPYTFVNTGGTLGTDAIRVYIIYRSATLGPVGSPHVDLDSVHNRPPTAQTFDVIDPANPAFGERFTFVANHSKSKGCDGSATGANADANDGQSCYNGARNAQASRLATWINGTVVPAAGDPDVVMVGDFNSYAQEDPILTLFANGFIDMETYLLGAATAYSYLFDGQLGHLDYTFASASLVPQVTGVGAWHINADEVPLFDYNDEIRDTGENQAFEEKPDGSALVPPRVVFQPASPFRASDHDPVLLGIFAISDLAVTKTDSPDPVDAGTNLTYTITITNNGPDTAVNASWSDTLPAGTTFVSMPNVPGWGCTTPAVGGTGTVSCTNSSFGVGSSVFTLTVHVGAGVAAGTVLSNTATATSDSAEGNPGDESDTATTTVAASANVGINKTLDTAGPFTVGQSVTYTITVGNAGPSVATNVSVTDTPSNLTITNVSGACTSFPCTIASLPPGPTTSITVTATIDAAGAFDNSATATADQTDPNTANNTDDTGNGGTAAASADVSVTKTLDTAGPYFVGQSVTYTINVANAGPSTATNITVTDTPTNLTITNVSGACTSFSPCTIASLASGASTNITVTATIDAAGAFDNSATATSADFDPNTADNTGNDGDTAAAQANVSVTKTLDTAGPYTIGQSVTYTIVVANAGPSAATNVDVTDTPTNLTITNVSGACGSLPCTIGSLASGASANITVTATIDSSGAFSNTATANGDESDPDGSDNSSSDGDVASQTGEVTATKSVSGTFVQGTNVTYTIVITNNMTVTQPNNFQHEFTDLLPAGLTYVSSTATSGTAALVVAPDTFAWNGSIPAGGSVTITITCTISPTATGTISNQGQTIFDTDGDNSNDSSHLTDDPSTAAVDDPTSFTVLQSGIVEITKSVSGTFVQGTNVTYTITLTNNMTVTQPDNFGHESTDSIPAGLTFVSANATSGTVAAVVSNTIVVWNGSIPSGGTVTITIVCSIDPTATGTISNQANSIFDKDGDNQNESEEFSDDPSTAAPNDPTSFTVIQANEVTATKAVSGTFVQGSNVTYTIVITNGMTVTQPDNFGHEFTDNLPAGLTLVPASFTATSGTTGSVSNIFFWDGSIPAGGTVTLTFAATIDPTATGTISNQGQTIFDKDGDAQNESSHLTDDPSTAAADDPTNFTVIQANDVTATKSVSGSFVQGSTVTYTVVITNNMTVTQPDNFGHEFTDNLPAGLTLLPGSFTATSGTTGSVSNIFFWDGSIPAGGTVTLTFAATISPSATGTISNQGQTIYDKNGDAQNESSHLTDDPSTAAADDPTNFTVIPAGIVSATKSVSGTFVQGSNVTYTIVVTNNMGIAQGDNAGNELTDVLPASLTLVSASATSGAAVPNVGTNTVTWNGALAAGASTTITINATINNTATGTVSNQANLAFDADGNGSNEASGVSDDPGTGTANDPTSFTVIPAGIVSATKSVSGTFVQGSNVTYTVVVTNNMSIAQADNAGNELTDVLPASLTLVSASATSGTATPNAGTNTVTWNGALAAGASTTITINATINNTATGTVSNQANLAFDADGNGSNESSGVSDDPATGTANDPTTFTVIPTGIVSATKSVSGTFTQGSNVTYTVVVTNNMGIAQFDNAGNELTDVLPASLTLVSASATSGTAVANAGTNTVTWNGGLAAGASTTITINATINNTATGTVSNQANLAFDADGNGSNESSGVSDDPGTAAANDPTSFTVTVTASDSDGDGVDDVVEQAAPNGGDGNGDGIPDHMQPTVASIPAATGSGYLTLQSSCTLQEVYVTTEGAMATGDPGFRYPHGLIAFRAPCSTATFSLFVYGSGAASAYRKFGPLPPGGPQQWYGIPATFTVTTVGSLHPRRIDFSLTDGATGDDTPVDGVIVDQGGPGDPEATDIPTASEWALMAMAAMLAAVALLVMKRG
ncbi:MAG TPA: ExeM/NucH family extracellular endonuclease [Thermoanaerobaculia bacterium]